MGALYFTAVQNRVPADGQGSNACYTCCAGAIMGALYFNADGASNDDSIGDLPDLPVPISYPQYGGFTLLPLEAPEYTARVGPPCVFVL